MQQTRLPTQSHTWWLDILILTLILGGLFFILLGGRPLFVPDEGRYAEIAREMIVSSDYITPTLNSIKYFEKPVLFYWLESAAIHIGGLNLWSIRSVNALLGLLGCLLTYGTARKLYDRTTGFLAASLLGTSLLYFVMAHMISLDLPVAVFLSITLYAFLLGVQAPPGNIRRNYLWGASAAAACAVLTKGLIGIVFPIMIVSAWIALTHEWKILKRLYLPSCILIFLLIAAPWHILVGQHNPEFFYFYFIKQHVLRYTTMKVGHYQPVWFFIPYLIIGFFPWIVFVPQAFMNLFPRSLQQCREHKTELFFLLWALLIFIFFSFSKSKLIPYILPVIPPLAILTARYLQQAMNVHVTVGVKLSYSCLLLMSALIACSCLLFPHYAPIPHPHAAIISLSLAAGVLMIGIVIATFFAFSNQVKRAVILTIATAWIFLLCIHVALSHIDTRTIAPLATLIKPILTPQDEIVAYNQYYQDLPFYLERRINILNWENELHFGMQHQDTHEWMIDDTTFWQRWHSKQRIFALMAVDEYQKLQQFHPHEPHYLIGQTLTNVLISNQNLK